MQPIFTDWQKSHAKDFGNAILNLKHNLSEKDIFSDAALCELIDRTPRQDYHISTMDPQSHDPKSRREGVIDGLNGAEVLEAIRTGHLWLNLRNSTAYSQPMRDLLEEIYRELKERVPGFKAYKEQLTILISSPNVHVGYHCDVPGQTLWQLRGRKRIWVYPNQTPFLPQPSLEKILLGEAHEVSLNYQPCFDEQAEMIDLEPGQMLIWPHNAPHRIVNHDCLNVSITTEHWTPELRNSYAVNYANGILRRRFGADGLSQSTSSMSFYPKLGLAAAYKLAGIQKKKHHKFQIDFRVDPNAEGGLLNIPAYEMSK